MPLCHKEALSVLRGERGEGGRKGGREGGREGERERERDGEMERGELHLGTRLTKLLERST